MKLRAVVPILSLALIGCASPKVAIQDNYYLFAGVCRHKAIYASSVVGEKYPVKIVVGASGDKRHAQAMAFIGKEWKWLIVDQNSDIKIGKQDHFTPDKEYSPVDYLKDRVLNK